MLTYPLAWIVVGSIALAIGVSTTLIATSKLEPSSNGEIFLGIVGIAVGLVVALFQIRQTSKMDEIIRRTKGREDRRKRYYLPRIRSYTELVKKNFDTLMMFIEKYEKDENLVNWQIAVNHSKSASEQIGALGQVSRNDFDHIFDLIENQYLADKYYDVITYLSQFTLARVIDANPFSGGLWQIKSEIKDQLSRLDTTIRAIDDEMPKGIA